MAYCSKDQGFCPHFTFKTEIKLYYGNYFSEIRINIAEGLTSILSI